MNAHQIDDILQHRGVEEAIAAATAAQMKWAVKKLKNGEWKRVGPDYKGRFYNHRILKEGANDWKLLGVYCSKTGEFAQYVFAKIVNNNILHALPQSGINRPEAEKLLPFWSEYPMGAH